MKIAVVAANGKAGKLIVEEAVNRGMDVTAIVSGENKTVARLNGLVQRRKEPGVFPVSREKTAIK